MKRFLRYALPVAFLLLLTTPMLASAAGPIVLLPKCATSSDPAIAGNCGISDILAVFLNIAEYLLGISGAVALGFFVYGGFTFILSRGSSTGVQKAFGILKSASIGIAIIFLSGVLVRFTIQSLTGGQSAIPTIGEPCNPTLKKSDKNGNGLWVSLPAGFKDGKVIPEGLGCVAKEDAASKNGDKCANLNGVLSERGLTALVYTCQDVASGNVSSCVRGLCSKLPAQSACCLSR